MLRVFCEAERGRQTKVANALGVTPSTVAQWFMGRRRFTGEQALAVEELLRNIGLEKPLEPQTPGSIADLHATLENPEKKNVWIRRDVQGFHHVIVGGPNKDNALAEIEKFLRSASG